MITDASAMDRAVALGWNGWGRVSPNPLVGCVLVADGAVVGEGWHAEFGERHAERMALDLAGPRARNATAVVTLEPCAHVGRQPPCTEALIAAGVQRVVVAVADPNPTAAGGAARLRAAGIPVDIGTGEREARYQLAAFLHQFRGVRRPWVVLKLATSLDGRIADFAGQSKWLTSTEARDWVQWLRAGVDAIGVGGATVAADDPMLTVRGGLQPRVAPARVVFAGREGVAADRQVLTTTPEARTVIVARPGDPGRQAWEDAGARVIEAGDLGSGLEQLWEVGVTSLLVEGGGRLAGALLAADLVDRACWIQAPLLLGEAGRPAVAGWGPQALGAGARWTVVERRALGDDTLLVLDRG